MLQRKWRLYQSKVEIYYSHSLIGRSFSSSFNYVKSKNNLILNAFPPVALLKTPDQFVRILHKYLSDDSFRSLSGVPHPPVDYIPNIVNNIQQYTPLELLVVISAYSSFPPPSDLMRLPAKGNTKIQFVDYLCEVMSSRLYHFPTANQLIDAGETLAGLGIKNNTFLQEYIRRLQSNALQHQLDSNQLSRVLHTIAVFNFDPNSNITHEAFVRAITVRLANDSALSTFSPSSVVRIVKNLASLKWEYKPLLTATANYFKSRIPSPIIPESLMDEEQRKKYISAHEALEILKAYGSLKAEFHMLGFSISDAFAAAAAVPALIDGPTNKHLLLNLDTNLLFIQCMASLNVFPKVALSRLQSIMPAQLEEERMRSKFSEDLKSAPLVRCLQALGRWRWRPAILIEQIFHTLKKCFLPVHNAEELSAATRFKAAEEAGCLLYELYRLDIFDEELYSRAVDRIQAVVDVDPLCVSDKLISNVLLSMAYFSYEGSMAPDLKNRIFLDSNERIKRNIILISKLLATSATREATLPTEAISQLKTFELAIRVGELPFTFLDLSPSAQGVLFRARNMKLPPERVNSSEFQMSVGRIAASIEFNHYSEVPVGPYCLDFVRHLTAEESSSLETHDQELGLVGSMASRKTKLFDDSEVESLISDAIVIEAEGPQHFYRGTDGENGVGRWVSSSKLKHRLLEGMGLTMVHVPAISWSRLRGWNLRRAYLDELLSNAMEIKMQRASLSMMQAKEGLENEDFKEPIVIVDGQVSEHAAIFAGKDRHHSQMITEQGRRNLERVNDSLYKEEDVYDEELDDITKFNVTRDHKTQKILDKYEERLHDEEASASIRHRLVNDPELDQYLRSSPKSKVQYGGGDNFEGKNDVMVSSQDSFKFLESKDFDKNKKTIFMKNKKYTNPDDEWRAMIEDKIKMMKIVNNVRRREVNRRLMKRGRALHRSRKQ